MNKTQTFFNKLCKSNTVNFLAVQFRFFQKEITNWIPIHYIIPTRGEEKKKKVKKLSIYLSIYLFISPAPIMNIIFCSVAQAWRNKDDGLRFSG